MKICGLDLSINSPGKCILDLDDNTLKIKSVNFYGFFMKKKWCLTEDNVEIVCIGTNFTKLNIFDRINKALEILDKDMEGVKFIACEGYAFDSVSGSVFQNAEVAGSLKKHFYDQGKGIVVYPPSVIKKFFSGNGRAGKNLMEGAFKQRYPEYYPQCIDKLIKYESPKDDMIDAFALAEVLRCHISFEKDPSLLSENIIKDLMSKSTKKSGCILDTKMVKK